MATRDERRLIESLSYIVDDAGALVGRGAKVIEREGESRAQAIEQLRGDFDEMRMLMEEVETELDEMEVDAAAEAGS